MFEVKDRPQVFMVTFETGTFIVDSHGEVEVDFLFDGGWFQGELAIFSLEGMMDSLEPGSTEFMLEAAQRAISDSPQGHIIIQDKSEGAHFEADLGYEPNLNNGEYQEVKTFRMNPGDEVAFLFVPNTTVQETYDNPDNISQFGKLPIFSIPEANLLELSENQFEFVDVDSNGTIALEDVPASQADQDYNDLIYQVQGLEGNLPKLEDQINPNRDWRTTDIGQQLLNYTDSRAVNEEKEGVEGLEELEGVFKVGDTGEIIVDYLFDGGFFQGEVGIFSLEDINLEDFGSEAFIEQAINRAQSNSNQGHVVIKDAEEGAQFSANLDWEGDFNRGEHPGRQTFLMNPGDTFGLILVPDGTLDEALTADESITSKDPLFSISKANVNGQAQVTGVMTTEEEAIISFEDTFTNLQSNNDYNDVILAMEGVQSMGLSAIEDVVAANRNWLGTEVGEDILSYFDNSDLT